MPGYSIFEKAVPGPVLSQLRAEAERLAALEPDSAHGIRDLLRKSTIVRAIANAEWLRSMLPADMVCVRGILFDKTPEANWLVPWHQDLTIAVRSQQPTPGYGPWSIKHGVPHVQAPTELLSRMMTLRLHLDDAGADNGALRVLPGSHREGAMDAAAIRAWRERVPEVTCAAHAGDVLAMRPLLLHASGKADASSVKHRRVVHLEFAPRDALATELAWYEGQLFDTCLLLLDPEPREGVLNMALDAALLEQATGPVLRVYRWAQPTISVGYGQSLAALGATLPPWPIVRRRTGGGAVWHDADEMTYSLIVPAGDAWSQTRPVESYRVLHESLAGALTAAGQGRCRLASAVDLRPGAACFQAPALHDILRDGQKIAGAGQRRTRHGLLHQGSVRGIALDDAFWQNWAAALASEVTLSHSLPDMILQRAHDLASDPARWLPNP